MIEGALIGLILFACLLLLANNGKTAIESRVRIFSSLIIFVGAGILIGGASTGALF